MIRIILKESKYGISNRDYGFKNVRFLRMIYRLKESVMALAHEEFATKNLTDLSDEEYEKFTAQLKQNENSIWLNVIQQIKPLQTEHIVKEIGFGRLGGAFRLTNGNILKVGMDSDGDDPELKWLINSHIPQQLRKRHFRGWGTASELHVYDSGDIDFGDGGLWSWREVPSYTTFFDWLDQKNIQIDTQEVAYLGQEINDILAEYSRRVEGFIGFPSLYKFIMKTRKDDYSLLKYLDEDESRKLLKAMYDITVHREDIEGNDTLDLKAENLGVDQHGNFVFFDF